MTNTCNKYKLHSHIHSGSVKTTWSIRECFNRLRSDNSHHLGHGDIILTMAQQEEICELVERFYNFH